MIMVSEHFVTCGQMKILERRADENGLSYYQMMENAGRRASEIIEEKTVRALSTKIVRNKFVGSGIGTGGSFSGSLKVAESTDRFYGKERYSALIFCGTGNNGGDGLVSARILRKAGWRITVILVDGKPRTEDSIENFGLLKGLDVDIEDMSVNSRVLMDMKGNYDVIIDAIYGTGFHGKLKENALKAAIYINERSRSAENKRAGYGKEQKIPIVFSLDIPSGLGGDVTSEKEIDAMSIKADFTIAFHARKPVHIQKFAGKFCGETIVADIGIDEDKLWNVEL